MRRVALIVLAGLFLIASCGGAVSPTPTPTLTPAPPSPTPQPARFEPVDCRFPLPQTCEFKVPPCVEISCGDLVVPESRGATGDGGTRTIRLHVALIKSYGDDPAPDPVVFLSGGPGGSALAGMLDVLPAADEILAERDLIVFDQRGVGYSEPALECPEFSDPTFLPPDEQSPSGETAPGLEALAACSDRLTDEGIDLSAYSSAESAADVNDLRIALGYDSWNLYGLSYGTRLALTILRDFPAGVRSVILDSVYPPQADLVASWASSLDRSLGLLFERCAADEACGAAFPDLEPVVFALIERLDREPITLRLSRFPSGEIYEWVVDGSEMVEILFDLLSDTDSIRILPRLIFDTHNGNSAALRDRLDAFPGYGYLTWGVFYSVYCNEEAGFGTEGHFLALSTGVHPRLQEHYQGAAEYYDQVCRVWGVGPGPAVENEPVYSDIPTLILVGEYDPRTPPTWGSLAAASLAHAYLYEFPGVGHGVVPSSPCARQIVTAFLDAPQSEPDSGCLEVLPPQEFTVP